MTITQKNIYSFSVVFSPLALPAASPWLQQLITASLPIYRPRVLERCLALCLLLAHVVEKERPVENLPPSIPPHLHTPAAALFCPFAEVRNYLNGPPRLCSSARCTEKTPVL